MPTKARRLFEDGARASRRARAVPCSGRRGNRASEVDIGLLGLPRQNIDHLLYRKKLHVDLTGQGRPGSHPEEKPPAPKRHRIESVR